MARKTKLMQRVEKEFSRPLERLLPEKVNEVGLSATAEELGVSKATLGYWLRLFFYLPYRPPSHRQINSENTVSSRPV